MNIAQHVERSARHFPTRPALLSGDRTITYAQLEAAASRTAHGLRALGVGVGDRVALYLPNVAEFPIAYLAALKNGAITVSINVMLVTDEIQYVLADAGARVLFTTAAQWPQVKPLLGTLPALEHVIVCEGEVEGLKTLAELGEGGADAFEPVDLERDAPAAILYTSGTTGRQKGATLSHGNVVSNMLATQHLLRIDPEDRLILFLPLFHCFGQNFVMNAGLSAGAAIVLHRRFEAESVLASIEEVGVTMFFGVPTVYIHLLSADVPRARFSGVRFFFSAAAPMPQEVAGRWHDTYGKPIYEGYGLTETSPHASFNHAIRHRPGSVGSPIENVEMKVLDPDDRAVPTGTWGEIVIRGPNVMLGYWNRPEETARALRGGWFHTGDVGYVDEDGYFHLVDRVKDMINAAGFKIWPGEVEEVLYRHPAIKECAVLGTPDTVQGESVTVFVAVQAEARVTAEELQAYCRAYMAAYKVPRKVLFVEELPKSATGKLLKRVLRERLTKDR
ncbi:MAG: long-chain fatty acid--CoA ligase [Anaeromyxobacteraceae bacterium]